MLAIKGKTREQELEQGLQSFITAVQTVCDYKTQCLIEQLAYKIEIDDRRRNFKRIK
jgi:hypothetical protein